MVGPRATEERQGAAARLASLVEQRTFSSGTLVELWQLIDHDRLAREFVEPSFVALSVNWVRKDRKACTLVIGKHQY